MKAVIGRLPILDQYNALHGYQLMHSRPTDRRSDATVAASQLMVEAFLDIGIEKIAGRNTLYVAMNEEFIRRPELIALPPGQVVLMFPASMQPSRSVIDGLRALRDAGHALGLLRYTSTAPGAVLAAEVDAVMLDTRRTDVDGLANELESLRDHRLVCIAGFIETMKQRAELDGLGFDCFHGSFLKKPELVAGQKLASSRVAVIDLLAKLSDPTTTTDDIERIITTDPALSLRVLRFVNSPMSDLNHEIESLHHAIVLVGRGQIKSWATLLTLSQLDDTIPELLTTMFVRARFCELFAKEGGMAPPEAYFTAGLFSLMDALMGVPMAKIVETLPFTAELKEGLVTREGPYGRALNAIELLEDGVPKRFKEEGLLVTKLTRMYWDAVEWADATMNATAAAMAK